MTSLELTPDLVDISLEFLPLLRQPLQARCKLRDPRGLLLEVGLQGGTGLPHLRLQPLRILVLCGHGLPEALFKRGHPCCEASFDVCRLQAAPAVAVGLATERQPELA